MQKQALKVEREDVPVPISLNEGEYLLFDFEEIECGFLRFSAEAEEESDIVLAYTEYCKNGDFSFTKMNAQNVAGFILKKGFCGEKMSFEPYTARKVALFLKRGKLKISGFGITEFSHNNEGVFRPVFQDAQLQRIYDAALRTFNHNAVDLYMDCPSRERAGWLCDSYFTGMVEHFLYGESKVEEAFLENYRLFSGDKWVPRGMLPDRYPADNGHGGHGDVIPQWCLWYILEVRDFLLERNKNADKELFRPSVEGILSYLEAFENEDGLLESVPGWNFVEWSDANNWTEYVNYPTNFLYSKALICADELFKNECWRKKGEAIKRDTTTKAFDGKIFVDQAVRVNGGLINQSHASEACQYYALLFGDVDLELPKYAYLKDKILDGFEKVDQSRAFVPVNAFIGLYLRLMTLLKLGYDDLLLSNVKDFFGGMIEKTNTLWEYREQKGSYDHGFASFAAVAIWRAVNKK